MVHFNDVLGVTAFILITSYGGNLSDYLSSGNWKSVPQQGCILINCTGPMLVWPNLSVIELWSLSSPSSPAPYA